MRACILQPAYLPWLGFLERVALCDVAVLLDHVEIDRSSKTKFANRNKIRTSDGWAWLTVPIRTRGRGGGRAGGLGGVRGGGLSIDAIEVLEQGRWREKHAASIRQHYGAARHWREHAAFLEQLYAQPWQHLAPLAEASLRYLLLACGIDTPLVRSSDLRARSSKSELILDLCRELGAHEYLSGPLGRGYLDLAAFERAGIAVRFHDYVHPVYEQAYPGFEPCLSALDLVLNHGPRARAILLTGARALAG